MVNYQTRRDNLTWQERQPQMRWIANRNFELNGFITMLYMYTTDKLLILMPQFDKRSPGRFMHAGCWFAGNNFFDKVRKKRIKNMGSSRMSQQAHCALYRLL